MRRLTEVATTRGHRHDAGAPAWLTLSMPVDASRTMAARLRAALPPVLILALAAGYLGADLIVGLPEPVSEAIPVAAGLVAVQALALVFRRRAPVAVFALVVLIDAVLLYTSAGELGAGALAVMIATYALLRRGEPRHRYWAVVAGAVVTLFVGAIAMANTASFEVLAVLAFAVARPVLQYVIPAALAEFFLSRARLVQALRDRAELAERERLHDVEREITGVRTAMARELHDIAAHHLSGIIVGAQAASALIATDPNRTRELLRTVQQDARTTLADLRRTVGLLRSDDPHDPESAGQPSPVPALERVDLLVQTARSRGQLVELGVDGDPRPLGPLAETAGYRMVQESLANAARHAPGAAVRVHVEYLPELVRITVFNAASVEDRPVASAPLLDGGYGISGMQERADLVGGRLTTGRMADGAWRNVLEIPSETDRSEQ